jgi:lysophospholipase L1-like esterase
MKDASGRRLDSFEVQTRPGLKKVRVAIGDSQSTLGAATRDLTQGTVIPVPEGAERLRIRVRNVDGRANTNLTSVATFTGFWVGEAALKNDDGFNQSRWTGNTTVAPVSLIPGFSVPTNGTDYVSGWVDASLVNSLRMPLLRWGITTPNSGSGISRSTGVQAVEAAGSTQASNATLTGASIGQSKILCDIRVEYEVRSSRKVGLFLTDSIGVGFGDGDSASGLSGLAGSGTLATEAWPQIAAKMGGFICQHAGMSSGSTGDYASITKPAFTRFDLAETIPDFAVIALGTNDLGAGYGQIQANMLAIMNVLRTAGVKRIYIQTLLPRNAGSAGTLTADATVGATTVSTSYNPGTVPIQFGGGGNLEYKTATAVTGSGPYMVTIPALSYAHITGEPVVSGDEATRQRVNRWIRQLPYGIDGVLDFDTMYAPSGSAMPDPRFMSVDLLHPIRSGHARMGTAAAVLGN